MQTTKPERVLGWARDGNRSASRKGRHLTDCAKTTPQFLLPVCSLIYAYRFQWLICLSSHLQFPTAPQCPYISCDRVHTIYRKTIVHRMLVYTCMYCTITSASSSPPAQYSYMYYALNTHRCKHLCTVYTTSSTSLLHINLHYSCYVRIADERHYEKCEIVWNRLKSSEIVWNRLKSIWNRLKSSEIVWNQSEINITVNNVQSYIAHNCRITAHN